MGRPTRTYRAQPKCRDETKEGKIAHGRNVYTNIVTHAMTDRIIVFDRTDAQSSKNALNSKRRSSVSYQVRGASLIYNRFADIIGIKRYLYRRSVRVRKKVLSPLPLNVE